MSPIVVTPMWMPSGCAATTEVSTVMVAPSHVTFATSGTGFSAFTGARKTGTASTSVSAVRFP